MSLYPARRTDDTGLTSRQLDQVRRAQASSELEVFRYGLGARARAEMDRIDSQAVADATRAALDEELALIDYGLARAGQSQAKAGLVARHVQRLSDINDRRLTRRFGAW